MKLNDYMLLYWQLYGYLLGDSGRLKPVLFVIPRVLAQDMVLGGYHVPAEVSRAA